MKNIDNFMEVTMGQSMKKADAGVSQYTTYLKPCLGVGIYNLKTDESYVGHYTDLMFFNFDKDMEVVKKDFSASNLLIFTAGGSFEKADKIYNESVLKDRKYVEKVLKENFSDAKINFRWSGVGEIVDLYLDKGKKEFVVERNRK